jgi:hypothetical protein
MIPELPSFWLVTIRAAGEGGKPGRHRQSCFRQQNIMRADSLFCGIRPGNADSPQWFIDSLHLQPL